MRVRVRLGPDPGSGIMAMVGYSFAGHILALIVMIFAPDIIPHRPPPPLVLTAQIVSLPQGDGAPPAPPRPEAAPRVSPTEMAKKAAAEAKKTREPQREEIPPVPDAPKPKVKPPEKPPKPAGAAVVDDKPSEKSRGEEEPGSEPEPAESPAQPAGPLTEGIGLGTGGVDDGSGIPSITSASFPYQYYRTAMVNKIRSVWRRPLTPGLRDSLRCAVGFVISKNGQISGAYVSVSSGFGALDDSALRAVMEANPLGPLPYQYTTPSVRAELIFELTPD